MGPVRILAALLALAACGPLDEGNGVRAAPYPEASAPDTGEIVVDLRPPEAFARRHLAGSVNLQWGWGQFEVRVGRMFRKQSRLVVIGPDSQQVTDAVALARAQGFTQVEGRVEDPADMRLPAQRVGTLPLLNAAELKARLGEGDLLVLDARTAAEYSAGHIAGAVFLYPDDIARIAPALRRDHPVAVVCEGGWRSSLVASWLARAGFQEVYNAIGGMAEWRREGYPMETGAQQEGFK